MKDDSHIEDSRMPLVEHLMELRTRLVWALVALGVAAGICFVFHKQITHFLAGPLLVADPGAVITTLNPQEAFFTVMNLAIWGGLFFGFPIIAFQLWRFVAPGLYKNEQNAFLPFLVATPFLFVLGASLAYYGVIPLALQFLIGFAESIGCEGWEKATAIIRNESGVCLDVESEQRFSEYVGFIKVMLLAFGVSFELPVLLTLLGRAGIVTSEGLANGRKYAVVGIAAVAAIITPPDFISQIALGVPVYLLYEISIHIVKIFEKRRAEREAEEEAELDALIAEEREREGK